MKWTQTLALIMAFAFAGLNPSYAYTTVGGALLYAESDLEGDDDLQSVQDAMLLLEAVRGLGDLLNTQAEVERLLERFDGNETNPAFMWQRDQIIYSALDRNERGIETGLGIFLNSLQENLREFAAQCGAHVSEDTFQILEYTPPDNTDQPCEDLEKQVASDRAGIFRGAFNLSLLGLFRHRDAARTEEERFSYQGAIDQLKDIADEYESLDVRNASPEDEPTLRNLTEFASRVVHHSQLFFGEEPSLLIDNRTRDWITLLYSMVREDLTEFARHF